MRRRKSPAPPVVTVVSDGRRGLVERIATRRVLSVLGHPKAAPVVAVLVAAVFAALAVGVVVGAALAASRDGGRP